MSGVVFDHTGQRFGKLVALRRDTGSYWICQCDCGSTKRVRGDHLRRGNVKSCGCIQGDTGARQGAIDMTGRRVGRWTVLRKAGNTLGGAATWECKCDCGNIGIVGGYALRTQASKSCGCLQADIYAGRNIIDLLGQRFGKLLVLERAESIECSGSAARKRRAWWRCQCDCGNITVVSGKDLRNGNTKSCGCAAVKYAPDESVSRKTFGYFLNSAKKRNIPVEITFEQWIDLSQQPCYLCGAAGSNQCAPHRKGANPFVYNGLDRVDNNGGYTIKNVRPCCSTCNRMKLDHNLDDFIGHLERVISYTKRP